jgi:hypothetical protein
VAVGDDEKYRALLKRDAASAPVEQAPGANPAERMGGRHRATRLVDQKLDEPFVVHGRDRKGNAAWMSGAKIFFLTR